MSESNDLERLFAARREIDRELMEKHARALAVLFTDIVGSTSFFERKGDIEGLALVKRHNDALVPLVGQHGGRVVKTIGDAIMAVFDTPGAASACAGDMQRALATANADYPGDVDRQIHVRIGLHTGRALLDGGDVFGDTVNVAARVNHEARADEVLLSEAAARSLPADATWPRGEVRFKGKSEPMRVFALNWGPGAPRPEVAATPTAAVEPARTRTEELFVLELARSADGIRVSALDGDKDKGTVKAFAEVPLAMDTLDRLARGFGAFMHGGPNSYRDEVKNLGEKLFAEALSPRAQHKLAQTELRFCRVMLEDALVHVPWELLHDGRDFLALRMAVGRTVATRAQTSPGVRLPVNELARALVVSNPSGDLPAAAREGAAVAGLLREGAGLEVQHLEGPVTREKFLSALAGIHWLHFAGHNVQGRDESPSGLLLSDGVVDAEALMDAVGARAPAVIFANACRASGEGWVEAARGVSSLASGLLMRGVQHYLGPMWELPDEDGLAFALRFYEHALSGAPLGEAVRRARQALWTHARAPLSFAGYALYGDPRLALPAGRTRLQPQPAKRSGELDPVTLRPVAEPMVTAVAPRMAEAPPARGVAMPPQVPEPLVPRKRAQGAVIAGIVGALALGAIGGGIMLRGPSNPPAVVQPTPAPNPTPTPNPTPAPADPKRHTGPLRLAVLPFKNVGGEPSVKYLSDAWPENLVTDLAGKADYQVIERGQLDVDMGELKFTQDANVVDPATRAQLGKIQGAEVIVLGSFQQEGDTVRATARFVNAETGEVITAVRLDKPKAQLLQLQDAVSAEMVKAVATARARLRP